MKKCLDIIDIIRCVLLIALLIDSLRFYKPKWVVHLLHLSVRFRPRNDPPYTYMIKVKLVIVVVPNNDW